MDRVHKNVQMELSLIFRLKLAQSAILHAQLVLIRPLTIVLFAKINSLNQEMDVLVSAKRMNMYKIRHAMHAILHALPALMGLVV